MIVIDPLSLYAAQLLALDDIAAPLSLSPRARLSGQIDAVPLAEIDRIAAHDSHVIKPAPLPPSREAVPDFSSLPYVRFSSLVGCPYNL